MQSKFVPSYSAGMKEWDQNRLPLVEGPLKAD